MISNTYCYLCLLFFFCIQPIDAGEFSIVSDNNPRENFAVEAVQKEFVDHLAQSDLLKKTDVQILASSLPERLESWKNEYGLSWNQMTIPESYFIRVVKKDQSLAVLIGAIDPSGAMYGLLDVAEAIRLQRFEQLENSDHQPRLEVRGIKFNIPLDLRTPSYSDNSDAAQENIPVVWEMNFWKTMLDQMAHHRYNTLTLWNLHPFPSIVKVPEYPQVALSNVLRGQRKNFNENFSHTGIDMYRSEFLKDSEIINRLTIDEKIDFWRNVMQHADDRGIKVYWFTWNTFLFGAEGKHGLSRAKVDDNMLRYFRASVRETVKTYPLLAGMGITSGESMKASMGGLSKEAWLYETYGLGIADALKETPDREFRLIHRWHQTETKSILKQWQDYPSRFELSFKYAIAHMYSIPNPPFINEVLDELGNDLRTWLTVRNDDIYSFRWYDPAYAREFIKQIPPREKVIGYYIGPDGFVWGRDFLTKTPSSSVRETIIEKQWPSFLLWGRLAFDPNITDAHLNLIIASHFGMEDPTQLISAWSKASNVFPLITRTVWGSIDVHWFPEACLSHPKYRGFFTVKEFIDRTPMPGSGVMSIRDWAKASLEKKPFTQTTPLQIAEQLGKQAEQSLKILDSLQQQNESTSPELSGLFKDIKMMAYLGDYYHHKLTAACHLATYDATSQPKERDDAVAHLEQALEIWTQYAEQYSLQYQQRTLYNRVGWVDRTALIEDVKNDVTIARQWKPGSLTAAPQPDRSR